MASNSTHMANDLTARFILSFSKSLKHAVSRGIKCRNRTPPRSTLFLLLLSLGQRWCCVKALHLYLAPVCPPLWAGTHADCLACCFALSLASVFFPISNYLLVSEVQPRIVHSISPTSSSPFGHRGVFRGESRL